MISVDEAQDGVCPSATRICSSESPSPLLSVGSAARKPAELARFAGADYEWKKTEANPLQLFRTPKGEAGCDQLDAM